VGGRRRRWRWEGKGGWGRKEGECVSGMGEEGRPLWAGVIREPFMGETITGCDSGAQPKSPLQPFASRGPSQPSSLHTIEQCAQPCTDTHTHTHTPSFPLVHIWPSLICCIRKDGGELKGGEGERQRKKKKIKHEATQHEHWHSSQIHNRHTQMLTHPGIQGAIWFGVRSRIRKVFI